ncbi:MAG: metal-dependent transcriptional regulator [Clostridia bacterium]|nr:metal-dependent transcriptional regulator [Clostridia bacterium]
MKHNQSGEDYLEAILLLSGELEAVHQIEVARKMGVSQPAVLKALKILKTKGYIETDGLHIYLTEEGKSYAKKVYHMHCTIKQFLILLGVNETDAEADACEMEHCISPATFSSMETFVKNNTK